jgi:hypothetical protein
MAVSLSTLVTRITAGTPATIATAFGGTVTAADITELQKLLTVMALRPGEAIPLMGLSQCALLPS